MSLFTTQGYRYQLVAGDNVILDTFADESIKISNNITELFDIGAVPGTFTRTITLPGTKKNNAFFEQYYDISVYSPDTFNSNQKVDAYLDFGAVYLVNGYLQLTKINVIENKFIDSYEVNVFGAISNFSVDANRLFLTDLTTLSQFNHTSSLANIISSFNGNLFSGSIVYPMADYGKRLQFSDIDYLGIDDSEDALTVSDYKPAIRIKEVFDGIFDQLGFTYTGSFFNQDWVQDVYMILNNNKRYPEYDYADLEVFYQGKVATTSGSYNNVLVPSASFGSGVAFPMDSIVRDPYNAFTVGNPFFYDAPISSSRYQVDINLAYRVVKTNNSVTQSQFPQFFLDVVRQSDNTVIASSYLPLINDYAESAVIGRTDTVTENFVAAQSFNLPYITNPGNYSFKLGYQPYADFGGGTIAIPSYKIFDVFLNPSGSNNRCSFAVTQVRQAADFQVLDIAKNMPFGTNGIKLIDFIRTIQKKFNLVIYEDKTTPNQMIVETFNTWYLQGQVQDFNQYINIDNKLEFIPANTLAVNKVNFTDKLDADFVSKDFQQINNRTFGQAFFIDTGSYFSQGEFKVETAAASGPIFQIPNTFVSGSSLAGIICNSYSIYNRAPSQVEVRFTDCVSGTPTIYYLNPSSGVAICSRTYPTGGGRVTPLGDCSPPVTGSAATSSVAPIGIPLYIGDQNYAPTQVFPRIMFYNGPVSSSRYFIEGQSVKNGTPSSTGLSTYPYFDNYNVVSGSYPTSQSLSLLFNNETSLFGTTPENSLIDNYWSTYLNLLYDPRTRLVNATAVIPLAKYFDMELNDLVQFRGNYYHLRAINDYDLTTGECLVQLLGPTISDALATQQFGTAPTGSIPPEPPAPPAPAARTTASIDFLVVAGGGGGAWAGGGGGAGAYRSGSLTLVTGSYTVKVGVGGTGAVYTGAAAQTGSDSFITFATSSITSQGGGIGGGGNGGNGGSGGGASYESVGGIGSTGGNDGGDGGDAPNYGAGGGGGASAVGADATSNSGAGGNGLAWLDGTTYAGGGGGGYTSQGATHGAGGSGGGGRGSINSGTASQPGTDGLGGGGGGGGNNTGVAIDGAKGGDGIVKIRYAATASFMTGGTITSGSGFVYHTFTNTTGSGTLSFT